MQDNRKRIFATDGILEQTSIRRTFKCVATVTCLIMAAPETGVFAEGNGCLSMWYT